MNVNYKYTLLQKDESNDMLGTAHQSILYIPETDECYIAYHRFYTPIGVYTDGLGYHRETCIDEVTFGEDGLMQPLSPTMEGVYRPVNEEPEPEVTLTSITVTPPTKLEYTAGEELDTAGMKVTAYYSNDTEKVVTSEAVLSGYDKDAEGQQTVTVTYTENGVEVSATFNVTVKAAGTEEPGTDKPSTDKPSTDKPSTDKPSSGEPSSDDTPAADTPSSDSGNDTASAVQTGDTTNLLVPAIVAVIALAAVAAVIIIRKKRK